MAWLRTHNSQVLIGVILTILPVVYFVYSGVSWYPLNPHEHLVQNGLAYLFLVLFSYFNHTIFVPRWFLNKQYTRYAIVAVSCVIGAAYLPHRIEQWFFFKPPQENTIQAWATQVFWGEMMLKRPPGGPPSTGYPSRPPRIRPFEPPLSAKLAIFFLLGSVSTLVSISIQVANRLRRVENDQLQAQLGQLKAQIQPHFLFNTLNSIYSLALRKDEHTADTILKLSEFMRYIIRDAHQDQVALAKEVQYITNYIDLQKARLRDSVEIDYRLEGKPSHLQIAPLLLFSFIENAFKYGVSPDEESRIVIQLRIEGNGLRLYVANNKVQVERLEKSTGIGLPNAKERLRLLYGAAHQLTIDDSPTQYRITLLLTLL